MTVMQNPLLTMVARRKMGIHSGIPSFCCANKLAIESILEQAQRFDDSVLIEATSNQVNQFGGYTDMTPQDFRDFVYRIADKIGFDRDKIILGGDHMGPLPWVDLPAVEAMEHAKLLVRQCVLAGYKKIHLDTSMRLGDDSADQPLMDEVIADRGATLYEVCKQAYEELAEKNPDEMRPVFVIGSEVPIPGGTHEQEEVEVTKPQDFERTLVTYKQKFAQKGLADAWNDIIAIVVQPGVEFGNSGMHPYDRQAATNLCESLKKYPDIVFEGHSTDYQAPAKLREMVEDGIAIIKVGPAVTFAVREGLFALSMMEKELVLDSDKRANFMEILEQAMLGNPKNWAKHYSGTDFEQYIARKYSYSDRCRYYLADKRVEAAMNKLFENFEQLEIPIGMLHQYMPNQYVKVRDGKLPLKARELVKDAVVHLVEDYNYAVKLNYMISGIFI